MTTLVIKCDDCGSVIHKRELSKDAVSRLYGRMDANPDGYSDMGNTDTIVKWDICTPCYEYEMQDERIYGYGAGDPDPATMPYCSCNRGKIISNDMPVCHQCMNGD